ncbi:MAG: cryptochrome/photolyase family protein [Cyanobacteria bacterium P01_A01_bin.37]
MTTGIWVLGDQLWTGQAALSQCEDQKEQTRVLFIESAQHSQKRPYHRQKLVLVWSAMRHFAEELRQAGWQVTYEITEGFETPLQAWVNAYELNEVLIMTPSDRPFAQLLHSLALSCPITFIPNNHFLWTGDRFHQWAEKRKRLLMESFYREGRKQFQVLMNGDDPEGGQWNYDKDNRNPPKGTINPPDPLWFEPDAITQDVIGWVKAQKFSTYGDLEPFHWAVTRDQALNVLDNFINVRLETFGPYQDAMVTGEDTMWHALLSPYLNIGLLQPLEVIHAVERAYHEQNVPLNSIEGFIRQVLGWREYMWGLYNYLEEDYSESNWFDHQHPLPEFFWDADKTDMNCLHQILKQVEQTGYAHHIQRLMVLSNFALIAGFSPQEVENWFHAVFIDAYDWVMQPNVLGMGLFADGGMLASKPYAASANYINKMSTYCKNCTYNHRARTGDDACPFNVFYWDFLERHRDKLKSQGRMNLILANLNKMDSEELSEIRKKAAKWHDSVRAKTQNL